jgi:hypothetical protein
MLTKRIDDDWSKIAFINKAEAEFYRLKIQEVRKYHNSKTKDGVTFCTTCLDEEQPNDYALWPCQTIQALNSDD